jgi:prolyl-tRNA editing enzyme YbaK/EbsC (Cys-tRNA(Pro) deacylase)
MSDLKLASQRVATAAKALGLDIRIVTHAQSTRTAEDAALACGCQVGAIVKSLVFQGKTTEKPYLLLVSGANRVDEKAVAKLVGEPLKRPDAAYVRDLTGYAIGGISPLGHDAPLATFFDRDLLAHATVWAAAGTPESVFEVSPAVLAMAVKAAVIEVRPQL